MVKKEAHPEFRFFEYLNGNLDEKAAQAIEAHLSACDDCALVAQLVRALKEAADEQSSCQPQASSRTSYKSGDHPDLSELASFFYTRSRRATASNVAAHVALCSSCGEVIARYARAERAAGEYNPASVPAGAVPANAWAMIREWEDSTFAKVKPANEVLGQELLTRLARILNEQPERLLERDTSAQHVERVPVLIVSRSGEVRSVEFFEEEFDSTGASVLRHSEGSIRFDSKPLLVLFRSSEKDSIVVSNPIRRDTIRLEKIGPEKESLKGDYIIIED
jgi:hypothetical protein